MLRLGPVLRQQCCEIAHPVGDTQVRVIALGCAVGGLGKVSKPTLRELRFEAAAAGLNRSR
jgi:hypothetical protein